ncbi:zinc-dependent alcohol dehydrogenase [Pseudonocardia spirodelae]|uniref:Alcohol dehydrogenase catalytic domain-containing protein n=1 Tax=Pseudonocardia spirodelae TaxID=3133431 RepID=A0ABU8T223_9PSEU
MLKPAAGPGVAYRDDVAEPRAGAGEVLLAVEAASLCGTDRELAAWGSAAQAFAPALPVVLGHEGAGTVLEIGPGVEGLRAGDRVALESHLACGLCVPCRTGWAHACERTRILGMHVDGVFAERVAVPAGICVAVPDGVGPQTAALLESAGVAMHAVQRCGYAVAGRSVLVSGCGPVGLAVVHLSRVLGAAHVVAVEPNPARRARAQAFGAVALDPAAGDVVATCRDLAGRRGGFDVAVECSGAPGTLDPLLASLAVGATLVTVGHPGRPAAVDLAAHVNRRQIEVRGIFGRRLWDTWEDLLLLVGSGRVELDRLVTHRLPLSAVDEALGLLTGDAGKVLLLPGLG